MKSIRILIAGLLCALGTLAAQAANTDIASTPLVVSSPTSVKANLLFILDDSGSMDFDFMPDHVNSGLCRSKGAGLDLGEAYSGTFTNRCCQGGSSSAACWAGAAPFGTDRAHPPFLSSGFNGMAYNPATRYLPPIDASGAAYPSQDRSATTQWTLVKNDAFGIQNSGNINLVSGFPDTEWCTDGSYTKCLRNGNYVLPGKVGGELYNTYRATTANGEGLMAIGPPDDATTETRKWGPHYYRIVPGEYCDAVNLRNCQATASSTYSHPAALRWCSSDADARAATPAAGSCQAARTDVYAHARYPTKVFTTGTPATEAAPAVAARTNVFTLDINGSCNRNKRIGVGTVLVNGVDLMGGVATSLYGNGDENSLANDIRRNINGRTATTGYSASGTGSNIVITAPVSAGNLTATASLSRAAGSHSDCNLTPMTTPAFAGYQAAVLASPGIKAGFAGSFERIDIVPERSSYPKSVERSDCAGATCSYDEEMSNFANWWTYYHTRMQSMKSSASRAFANAVGSNRRVGYLSINNNTGTDFLNLDTFEDSGSFTQKSNWFGKLFKAKPSSSTPLRTALSRAGRLYGGRLNDAQLNGSTVKDPMQYSCQRNFTILSTDGFWNETATLTQFDGTTEIGDQDGALARPMLDGNQAGNTLSDVAAYYYRTDSRTGDSAKSECKSGSSGEDVCGNSADKTKEPDEVQNMRTFTLGLGASGYMQFNSDYLNATSGDFYAIKQGSTPNAATGVCSWESGSKCNWPLPKSNELTTIDDLWHAAVNGGGSYFSATNPTTLYTGLATALNAIDVQTKAAAAATTSNPNVSAGDNQLFVSNFSSGTWSGELMSQRINVETGAVDDSKQDWSARALLNANTSRTIYMFSAGASDKLRPFTWSQLGADERAYFSKDHLRASGRALSQFCDIGIYCLTAADQTLAAGEPLLNFLRGDRSNEGDPSQASRYFRQRSDVLGDIVNSEAVFVKQAMFNYADAGYRAFQAATNSSTSGRQGMVYVGANDGMLHAFSASTGQELWAYVPTAVLPKLYKLADKEYASKHEYFVDGTPTVQEVYIGGQWRTLLVSGLGAGGRAYFALDVTDPTAPKALWEFTHDNLGLSMGKPEIGKLSNGNWAVFFGSGYNNVSPGTGRGYLFVVDAASGSLLQSLDTGAGSSSEPSGLAHIRAWVDNGDADNTVQRVYGGDNLGNLWRFDVNDSIAPGSDAQRLATLKAPDGKAQPITSRPELGQVGSVPMVYVGTGRYLGQTDLSDATQQSIYAIKDRLNQQDFGDPRDKANKFVAQELKVSASCPEGTAVCSAGSTVRTNENPKSVDLAHDGGWYVDLPAARERVNTDPQLALGTLVVNSNVIDTGNVCKVGGSSYANFLDYATGRPISTAKGVVSVPLGNAIATRPALIKLPNNKVISVTRLSDNRTVSTPTPIEPSASSTRRLSWRDLIQD